MLVRKCRLPGRIKEKVHFVERLRSCFPPLPLARELKVGLALETDRSGGRLRRSPGLAAVPPPFGISSMGPVLGLPVALPFISGAISERDSRTVSDTPQWPQQYLIPPYSRAAATAFSRLAPGLARVNAPSSRARSPRGVWGARWPARGDSSAAAGAAALG